MGIKKGSIKLAFMASVLLIISISVLAFGYSITDKPSIFTTYASDSAELKIANVIVPKVQSSQRFPIHYELSERVKLPTDRKLKTFVEGEDIVADEGLVNFDGKNINWRIHAKRKGIISFNITLYDGDQLLDSKQASIYVQDIGKYFIEHQIQN